jgi:LAO/AO transport system kinase
MIVVEAAGYDVVLVETVGVGQSEIAVANMVDTFLVLALARTGDSLQGIKRGVLELADLVAVNKADGAHVRDAEEAASELRDALRLVTPAEARWKPPVLTCSGLKGTNLDKVWEAVVAHREQLESSGELAGKHQRQQVDWMWSMVFDTLVARFKADPRVRDQVPELEAAVRDGTMTPTAAARQLLGG